MSQRITSVTLLMLAVLFSSATVPARDSSSGNGNAPLYDRLGGLMPLSVVVNDFIDAIASDPVMNENPAIDAARKRVPVAYLKYHVTAFVCLAAGGPCGYTGRAMPESHAHLNISEREWDRMLTLFDDVLASHDVPEREVRELVELLGTTKDAIVSAD